MIHHLSLHLLRDDLDGGYGGVIADGNEFEEELALGVGLQACNFADERAALTDLFENVHFAQDELAIAEYIEEPGS